MTFGFDGKYAMFGVTPVDNQFILECVPQARGDYVRVYLYGLLACHHPEIGLNLDQMVHELNLTEDEILKAFRYWERRGLVRRISDAPPSWQYISWKERSSMTAGPEDPEYEAFGEALYAVFDNERRLHGKEIQTCYEWVEDLKLPMEAVIMLLKHMARVKGKNFSIQSAGKVALEMAEADVQTLEDAENFLSRDQQLWDGVRRVLKKLGKRGMPSEAQADMYRKWILEWRFTPETVEAACAETAKGDPSMGYLEGILKNIRAEVPEGTVIDLERYRQAQGQGERLKSLLGILGSGNVTEENKAILAELERTYEPGVIEIGARECARNRSSFAELPKLLEAWRKKGLYTQADVEEYVAEFRRQNELLKKLREKWNAGEPRIGETSRKMVSRWKTELGFDEEMILKCAEFASEAKAPMAYLDRILTAFREKGIRTPAEAEQEHQRMRREKQEDGPASGAQRQVTAQQYVQREYSEESEKPEAMLARLKEAMGNA